MKPADNYGFMKVAFDASALKPQYNHHGIQVYTRNLLAALQQIAGPSGMEIRPFLPSADSSAIKFTENTDFHPRKSSLMRFDRLWRYGGACTAAFLDGADVMLNPNGASLPINTLLPTITTIHDLTPMVMPCFPRRIAFFLKFLLTRSAKSSAAIITVSENSRQDIVRICGVPESKVHVVYEGYDRDLFNAVPPDPVLLQKLLNRLGVSRPYILHHGAIQPRKNLPRLIAAYRLHARRGIRNSTSTWYWLVLSHGSIKKQWMPLQAKRNGKSKVVLTGALDDRDLSLLVRGASLEVIPSLYEGFCLPMVEAMACGIPTIAANSSCLPEISGGVLRYFDPRSVEDMAACMETVLLSHDLQAELAERGRERAQKFSWDALRATNGGRSGACCPQARTTFPRRRSGAVKIAIDSWTLASRFRCQGTYVYAQNLLHEFKKIARQDTGIHFSLFASSRNGNDAIHIAPEERFELCSSALLDHDRLWRFGGAGLSASRSHADVLFIPTPATLPVGPIPAVCAIHDVTPITMPSHSTAVTAIQRVLLKGCARLCRVIITSSECSKRDIVAHLGVPEEKVAVIHDGCDQSLFNSDPPDIAALATLRARLGIEKPYLLHHGTIQPRKNLKRLIEAFRLMLARKPDLDFDLVLAGRLGWASDEIVNAAAESLGRGRVINCGHSPRFRFSPADQRRYAGGCPFTL